VLGGDGEGYGAGEEGVHWVIGMNKHFQYVITITSDTNNSHSRLSSTRWSPVLSNHFKCYISNIQSKAAQFVEY
jgi:glutamine synthetase